jgi:hypothetical protein
MLVPACEFTIVQVYGVVKVSAMLVGITVDPILNQNTTMG